LGCNCGELALLGRGLIFGHRDIAFDRHAVVVVSGLGLANYAIKLQLLMKSGVAGDILPVGAQINCLRGATGQREHPKQ
jgi:glutaminase